MIRIWLTRLTALAVLAVQVQPMALALLCDSRAVAREDCGGPMRDEARSISAASTHDDHAADCFRMGPCATAATWNIRSVASSLVPLRETTLHWTEAPQLPPSLDLAPVPPPPQA